MASTWYVGPGGTDSAGHGTNAGDPFLTYIYALSASAAGDTIRGADAFNSNETNSVNLSTKAKTIIGAGVGTIIQSTATTRVIYAAGAAAAQITDVKLYEQTTTAAGTTQLIEHNAPGDLTCTRVYFDNGRYRAAWYRPDATGQLTFDDCTFLASISTNYAFCSLNNGPGGIVVNRLTASSTATPAYTYILHQLADFTADATALIDDSDLTFLNNAQVVRALNGRIQPTVTNCRATFPSLEAYATIECNNCTTETIEGNSFRIYSILDGAEFCHLYSVLGTASVASVKDNTVWITNGANHVIYIGGENTGVTSPNSHDGTIVSGNVLYTGTYFGNVMGTNHAILAGFDRCHIRDNRILGAGYGIVLKHEGGSFAGYPTCNNELINCKYNFRIKGAPETEIISNRVTNWQGSSSTVFSITDNDGDLNHAVDTLIRNNIVDIDSGVIYIFGVGSKEGLNADWNYYSLNGSATFQGANATLAAYQASTGLEPHSGTFDTRLGYGSVVLGGTDKLIAGDNFSTALSTRGNGGRLRLGARIEGDGLLLDGTGQHAKYDASKIAAISTSNPEITIEVTFSSDVGYWDNSIQTLFSSYDSSATQVYSIAKLNNASSNVLRIILGGITIVDIPVATYAPYWLGGQDNTIRVSSNGLTPDTDVWLNGTQIVTSDATGWSRTIPDSFYVGSDYTGANGFTGRIKKWRVWAKKLDL